MFRAVVLRHGVSTRVLLAAIFAVLMLLVPAGLVRASGPDGAIEGYIRDGTSSTAVAGASVRVTASNVDWVYEASTDAAGHYRITLPNHVYTLRVWGPAYNVNTTTVGVGSAETTWSNMSLSRAASRSATLQGYVTDSVSSAPVTTGQVVATTASWVSPAYTNASPMDGAGYYRMTLIPGAYQITTSGAQGYAAYSYTYLYPGTGSNLWFNFSLTANPLVAWINGTVEDARTYAQIVGASISVSVDGVILPSVQSNATGEYSVHVPTGDVQLTADAPGHAPDTASVYVSGPYSYSRYLYLDPLATSIRGWVRDGLTGDAVAGASVTASPFWSSGYYDRASSDAGGYYELDLTADDFDLVATATGYTTWYTYEFLSTGDIVFDNVTLWPIVSHVQGYLLDELTGDPVAGRSVYAYDSRAGYSASDVSDSSGFYAFAITPGPASAVTVSGVPPYAGTIVYPNIPPYVTTWLNITLARVDAELDVNVTDASTGLPLSGAYLTAYWAFGTATGVTDASGLGAVGVPSSVAITLYGSATGYLTATRAVAPFAGAALVSISLNPNLPANVTVQGYVRDASTSDPISSVSIRVTGYDGSAPWDYTDGTGHYAVSIVARPQVIRATQWGYSMGLANVAPTTAGMIWVNFTLASDVASPIILDFTATPSTAVGPTNPTTLEANVNESSLTSATINIFKLWSSAAGQGTFLSLGQLPTASISMTPTTIGNSSVATVYDAHTPIGMLSDGTSATWWPTAAYYYSIFQVVVAGQFDNATLPSPVYATAVFDRRSGDLLYVAHGTEYIEPEDQPTATFTPTSGGYRIDLTTAAIIGYTSVTGPTFQLGSLSAGAVDTLSGGQYAAFLYAGDAAGNYDMAAALFGVTADTTLPVARAGPNQAVDQGATVTLDGTASTDDVGVVSYTWTFTDGTAQVLHGATVTHLFLDAGTFLVLLTVRDAAGNSGTSTMTVTVRDTTPPTVALTAPTQGATVSGSVGLAATVSDNIGVVRVEFLVDGTSLGSTTAAPFTMTLDTTRLTNGNHTVRAVAYDAAGNSAESSRTISVANAPSGSGPLGIDSMIWLLLLVVLAAVGAVVILLVLRRRRAPPSPSPPPPSSKP